ncbi:putative hemolysin [Arthrobacter sp. PvP102]|uniref:hemolysin family protein n=1 Tax=unclassified Arthrobacter TaxID=235627 RepID=UPI001AE99C5C|nr:MULTISPECIES: hemolysin family protein [unclassified Arthrobacter]MBP1234487.1 putative hemolysin [Arthrobacter sp. PvP103]MBP1239621.1 putative hemolysin [Arthrobacter sp. PvP102]
MDSGTLVNFALVLFFVLLGGVFAGTEMALISLRESQVRMIEKAGKRGARAAALARNPNRFLSTVQIGVTLSGFFSAAYGASTISPDIEPVLERLGFGAAAEPVAFIGMTLLVAYLSLVLGELVPKRLAMQSAVGFTKVLAPPLVVLSEIMRPVIWLLSVSTDAVVKLFGGDPHAKREGISSEELWDMVAESDLLEESSRHILTDVFGAGDRTLQEVMRPRTEVTFIDGTMTIADARSMVRDGPYSRFPVIGRTPDDVLGFVHIRDLMTRTEQQDQGLVKDIVRELLPLPGTNRVLPTLSRMRRLGHHIALVVDEYGGTDGIVTLEDLVEELVGEIYDEYDTGADHEDRVTVANGSIDVDGGLILQEFAAATGITLPEGRYETVAGFAISRLGRLPVVGDRVQVPGHVLTVLAMDRLRIARIRVTPADGKTVGPSSD